MARSKSVLSDVSEDINRKYYEVRKLIDELPIAESAKKEALSILREHCDTCIAMLSLYIRHYNR